MLFACLTGRLVQNDTKLKRPRPMMGSFFVGMILRERFLVEPGNDDALIWNVCHPGFDPGSF